MAYNLKKKQYPGKFEEVKEKISNLYWKSHPKWYLDFKNHIDEKFKPIDGFYGIYFISNYGQVVSFHKKRPTLLAGETHNGFLSVILSIGKASLLYYVHELVYNYFNGEQENFEVIHKNGIPSDNYYKNLKLRKPSPGAPRSSYSRRKQSLPVLQFEKPSPGAPRPSYTRPKPSFPVLQFDKHGKFLGGYPSILEAAQAVETSEKSIAYCIQGKTISSAGYQWRSGEDPSFSNGIHDIDPIPPVNPRARAILQFHRNGKFIKEYPSISEAMKQTDIDTGLIVTCAQGKTKVAGGCQWYYRDHPAFNFGIIDVQPVPKFKSPNRRAVLQFDLDGNFIKEYPSLKRAARAVGVKSISNLSSQGKTHSWAGFQWRYSDDPFFKKGIRKIPPLILRATNKAKPVVQFTKEGKHIREYRSLSEAMQVSRVSTTSILQCIEGKKPLAGGFQWRLKSDLVPGTTGTGKSGRKIEDIEPIGQVPPPHAVRAVCQFSLEGKFLREFPSFRETQRKTGIHCLQGALNNRNLYKSAGGFQWRYRDDPMFKNGIIDIPPVSPRRRYSFRKRREKPVPYDYSTPILQFDKEGKYLREYPSIIEAEQASKVHRHHIVRCTRGKEKCAGGFQWRYKNDPAFKKGILEIEPAQMDFFTIPVLQFDLKGNFLAEYSSYAEAARAVGIGAVSISDSTRGKLKTAGGFQWRSKNDPRFKKGIVNIPPLKKVTGIIRKTILQFDSQGKFIRRFPSMMEAARAVNRSVRTIRAAITNQCLSAAGFQWRSINNPVFEKGIVDIEPLPSPYNGKVGRKYKRR